MCVGVVLRCCPPDDGLLGLTEGSPFGWVPGMSYPEERMITCLLSSELKRLNIGIAALYEVWKLGCGEIMAGGKMYYWSGGSDGYHAQGVAVAVSNKLTQMKLR